MAPRKKILKTEWVEHPTPYQMCQRYHSGTMTEDQLIDELVAYDYAPIVPGLEIDDPLLVFVPSSWVEVESAAYNGLIDGALYNRILEAVEDHESNQGTRMMEDVTLVA